MIRRLLIAASALAIASPVCAQPVVQTGAVQSPGGVTFDLSPTTTFVQSCNSGAGGIVGQGSCALPTSGGGSGGGNAAASATGTTVPTSAGYTGFNSGGNLVGVSSASPLPVTSTSPAVPSTASSGTTSTTALAFTTLIASNTARKGCLFANTSTSPEYIFIGSGTAAVATSYLLNPATATSSGGTFSCASGSLVISDALQIAGTTASDTYAGNIQ